MQDRRRAETLPSIQHRGCRPRPTRCLNRLRQVKFSLKSSTWTTESSSGPRHREDTVSHAVVYRDPDRAVANGRIGSMAVLMKGQTVR